MSLRHLTVNTGDVALTERADVRDSIIELLRPMIEDGAGQIPGPVEWWLDVWSTDGGAAFQIAPGRADTLGGKQPYVMCFAAWDTDASADVWQELVTFAASVHLTPPSAPPATPWLAVVLLPWLDRLPPEAVHMLGDLERCIFWTLADD